MTGNGYSRIYGEVVDTFERDRAHVLEALEIAPIKSGEQMEITPTFMTNYGSSPSGLVRLNCRTGDRSFDLLAKYYGKQIRQPEGFPHLWEKDASTGEFLRNNAGISNFPRTYLPEDSRILFLEWLGGSTLLDRMRETDTPGRVLLLKRTLGELAAFQYYATMASKTQDPRVKKIFAHRSPRDSLLDYLGDTKDDLCVAIASKLVWKAREGYSASHGDLSPTNVILSPQGSENPKVHLIDPKLRFGNELNDVGDLFAYIGIEFPDVKAYWEELASHFKAEKGRVAMDHGGLEGTINRVKPETARAIMQLINSSIFYQSARILKKNYASGLFGEEVESRLVSQAQQAIAEIMTRSLEYGLSEMDINAATKLMHALSRQREVGKRYKPHIPQAGSMEVVRP